jgi:hypothetical protein
MTILKFNTGRTYTTNGQRIAAALQENGDIVFVDVDRRIEGTIRANGLTRQEIIDFGFFTQRGVLQSYDENQYTCAYDLDDDFATAQQLRDAAESI